MKKKRDHRYLDASAHSPSHPIEIIAIKLVLPLSGTGSRRPPPKWISLIFEYTPGIWALHCKFSWPFEKWNGWRFILISIHWRSSWSEWASLRSHLCCDCGWCLVCDSTCEKSNVNWISWNFNTGSERGNESNSVAREHVTVYGMDEKGRNNIGKRGMEPRKCKSAFNEIRSSGIEKRTFRFASSNPPFSLSLSLSLYPSPSHKYRMLVPAVKHKDDSFQFDEKSKDSAVSGTVFLRLTFFSFFSFSFFSFSSSFPSTLLSSSRESEPTPGNPSSIHGSGRVPSFLMDHYRSESWWWHRK